MTLTFELDLDIFPPDLRTEIQVCMSVHLAVGCNNSAKTYFSPSQALHFTHEKVSKQLVKKS